MVAYKSVHTEELRCPPLKETWAPNCLVAREAKIENYIAINSWTWIRQGLGDL